MRSTIKARLEVILAIVVTILTASVAIGVSRMAQGHADIVGIIDGPAKRQARSLPVQVAANDDLTLRLLEAEHAESAGGCIGQRSIVHPRGEAAVISRGRT